MQIKNEILGSKGLRGHLLHSCDSTLKYFYQLSNCFHKLNEFYNSIIYSKFLKVGMTKYAPADNSCRRNINLLIVQITSIPQFLLSHRGI